MQLFTLQMFEWRAMLYLIKTQKDKSIGQIFYDHNSENIFVPLDRSALKSKQLISRRREIRLKKQFRLENVLMIIAFVFLMVYGLFDLHLACFIILSYTSLIYIAILCTFVQVYCLMSKLHYYEF